VLTGAGSTGLSVQASPAVGSDLRQRVMIKWEMQADIAAERQIDGRPDRTGQVVKPIYLIPMTGLPADDRLAMMFNGKNRSLTSSTEANRDSKSLIREVPDLLNVVGNDIAFELLDERPDLAAHLDVDVPKEADALRAMSPQYFINKLTGRIGLLFVEEQEALYAELQARFNGRIDQLTAEGKNPLIVRCLEWRAKVLGRELFQGEQKVSKGIKSQLNSPVFLTELEYGETLVAVKAEQIDARLRREATLGGVVDFNDKPYFAEIGAYVARNKENLIARNMSRRFRSVAEALADKGPNETKTTVAKIRWLEEIIPNLGVGSVYFEPDLQGDLVPHVVLRASAPMDKEAYLRLSEYVLYVVRPGSNEIMLKTASQLFSMSATFLGPRFADLPDVRRQFDEALNGVVSRRACVLDGNLFEAVAFNLRESVGSKIVYTDQDGVRQHGVLVRKDVSVAKLKSIPERVRNVETLMGLLDQGVVLTDSSDGRTDTDKARASLLIKPLDSGVALLAPDSKVNGGGYFLDPVLARITGKEKLCKFGLSFSTKGGRMVANVEKGMVFSVLSYLVDEKKIKFFVSNKAALAVARSRSDDAECNIRAVAA